MSDTSVGQKVVFTISGILYEGRIAEEKGDQLVIHVIRQGGRATQVYVMVSRKTVLSSQELWPPASEDLLVRAGSGSGRGYAE